MTFSLAIANGDLVQQGSQLGIVANSDKLKQDLTLWMTERFGIDRFHPAMGSMFQNYIGGVINFHTQGVINSETDRILGNYSKVQTLGLRAAPTRYSLSELLYAVTNVQVGVGFDTVQVAVTVTNAVQQPTTVQIAQGA